MSEQNKFSEEDLKKMRKFMDRFPQLSLFVFEELFDRLEAKAVLNLGEGREILVSSLRKWIEAGRSGE